MLKRLLIPSFIVIVGLVAGLPIGGNQEKDGPDAKARPMPEVEKKVEAANAGEPKATTVRVWRATAPTEGHFCFFMDRKSMWGADKTVHFKLEEGKFKAVTLPIDWAKSFSFPTYLNDQYGDCYYAAGCHADNTWTANASTKSDFLLSSIKTRYFKLSGGDNGLNDSDMQGEMLNHGLGVTAEEVKAKIVSWANVDSNDANAMQSAIQKYGLVMFTFAVANNWINNSSTGSVWDSSTFRANNNGHAVLFNGVDTAGKYKLLTWGTYVWITPAGVKVCDPGAWVAFSTRWFNSAGYAPNGTHIVDLAKQWKTDTGKTIPDSVVNSFPAPVGGAAPVITSPLTVTGTVGQQFSYQIIATNAPTIYGASGLPAGLSMNTGSGHISGTLTTAGTSQVNLTAQNASGNGSATLTITVGSTPTPSMNTITWTINGVTQQWELFPLGTRDKLQQLIGPMAP